MVKKLASGELAWLLIVAISSHLQNCIISKYSAKISPSFPGLRPEESNCNVIGV